MAIVVDGGVVNGWMDAMCLPIYIYIVYLYLLSGIDIYTLKVELQSSFEYSMYLDRSTSAILHSTHKLRHFHLRSRCGVCLDSIKLRSII